MKIKNLGLVAILLIAIFVGAVATASAVSIPSTAKPQLPDTQLGDINTWSGGGSISYTIKPDYVQTIYFSPKRAGTWNTEAQVYGVNLAANKGIVEYAWRSGSGSWKVWRTAEYGRLDKKVSQTLTSGDAKIEFRIRMYNPNVGISVLKPQNLQSYFYIKKVN